MTQKDARRLRADGPPLNNGGDKPFHAAGEGYRWGVSDPSSPEDPDVRSGNRLILNRMVGIGLIEKWRFEKNLKGDKGIHSNISGRRGAWSENLRMKSPEGGNMFQCEHQSQRRSTE